MHDDDFDRYDDDGEDDYEPRATDSIGNLAPWTPDFLAAARAYRKAHPDAALNLGFPQVFEEDRGAKIKDLQLAYAEGAISHRHMSEQIAAELGLSDYDYLREQASVQRERAAGIVPELGSGDGLAPRPPDEGDDDTPPVHRAELSGDATAEFRRQQRQAEAVMALAKEVANLREALGKADERRTSEALRGAPPAPSAPPLFKKVVRDADGRVTHVRESFGAGLVRVLRVVCDGQGRIVGLEPEAEHPEEPT